MVREHEELVFISQNGMVQRTGVRGINRYGRPSQGVRVMNLREGDEVSAVALVVETDAPTRPPATRAERSRRAASIDGRRAGDASGRRRRAEADDVDPAGELRACVALGPPRSSLLSADQRKGVVRS